MLLSKDAVAALFNTFIILCLTLHIVRIHSHDDNLRLIFTERNSSIILSLRHVGLRKAKFVAPCIQNTNRKGDHVSIRVNIQCEKGMNPMVAIFEKGTDDKHMTWLDQTEWVKNSSNKVHLGFTRLRILYYDVTKVKIVLPCLYICPNSHNIKYAFHRQPLPNNCNFLTLELVNQPI